MGVAAIFGVDLRAQAGAKGECLMGKGVRAR